MYTCTLVQHNFCFYYCTAQTPIGWKAGGWNVQSVFNQFCHILLPIQCHHSFLSYFRWKCTFRLSSLSFLALFRPSHVMTIGQGARREGGSLFKASFKLRQILLDSDMFDAQLTFLPPIWDCQDWKLLSLSGWQAKMLEELVLLKNIRFGIFRLLCPALFQVWPKIFLNMKPSWHRSCAKIWLSSVCIPIDHFTAFHNLYTTY